MRISKIVCVVFTLCCTITAICYAEPWNPSKTSAEYDSKSLISLAKAAIKAEVECKPAPTAGTKTVVRPVFVTIERKGLVVGCRGSLDARTTSLESEVISSARSAASHDPRYRPLTVKDLGDFQVTITVVQSMEAITNVSGVQPRDGIVLKSGSSTGVVLPWEGKDPKTRLGWAYKKAGVAPGSSCQIYRLKAERFKG